MSFHKLEFNEPCKYRKSNRCVKLACKQLSDFLYLYGDSRHEIDAKHL